MDLRYNSISSIDIANKELTYSMIDLHTSAEDYDRIGYYAEYPKVVSLDCDMTVKGICTFLDEEHKLTSGMISTIEEAFRAPVVEIAEKKEAQTVSEFLLSLRQGSEPLLDTFLRNEDVCLEKFFHKTTQEVVVKGAGKGDVASIIFVVFKFICGETFKKVKDTTISYSNKGRDYGDKLDSVWDN